MLTASRDSRPVVAAFDVDGTLTTRDCVTPFLRRVAGRRLAATLARHPLTLAGALARRDHDRLKELACCSLRGIAAEVLEREGERFADVVLARRMRRDTSALLHAHRARGHRVVLVSASLEAYLRPLGAALGVDGVVCTRLEVGADGLLTGKLAGGNCRGPEKTRRLTAWLDENDLHGAEVWAYGDSSGDAELLAAADHAVWVGGRSVSPDPGSNL